jgi:transcriptional regulator GlxA family with amidase domain
MYLEKHYTPTELADIWAVSSDTITRLFRDEPGVLIMRRRKNALLRIPESVVSRVHNKMIKPERAR